MKQKDRLKWVIWTLAALFYFYEFVLRVSPSVLVNNLMLSFGISATTVGVMSAFYLYAYAPMQLPVGLLIDRFGVKKLLSSASVVCGLGAMLFALSRSVAFASAGRFLIGAGSAFAFVSMVYISSHWFPKKRRAFLIGIANSIAMLGASMGGGPLSSLIKHLGWRTTIFAFGIFGILLAIAIFVSLKSDDRDRQVEEQTAHKKNTLSSSLKAVFSNWKSWINALVAICFYMATTAFAGLWGIPFVEQAYGVSKTIASYSMSLVFVGWLVGGPIIGYISDLFEKRLFVVRCMILCAALFMGVILYATHMPIWLLFCCTFLLGICSSAELLNFTIAIEVNATYVKATAAAFTNFMVSIGDSISQPLVGFLLDLKWNGKLVSGVREYSTADFQQALIFIPIIMIAGFLISFALKTEPKAL